MALPDVDVVILATPPQFRPEHFLEAVTNNKHVFMEKPVAVDPVGIRSVITSARKAEAIGLNVVTGTQRRHQEDYIETYKHVAKRCNRDDYFCQSILESGPCLVP